MKQSGIAILSIFFLFLVWVISGNIVDNSLLLPKLNDVFVAFGKLFIDLGSLKVMFYTILRLIIGLLIAFIFGFLFGIFAGFKQNVASFLNPIVTMLRTVPVISITVILLIMFGNHLTPYIITFLMVFPLIYQGIFSAISNINPELIDVYKLENNNFISGLIHCYIPLISREIRTYLLQSMGLGIKVLVMAEYLSQTKNSIGQELYLAKVNLQYDKVFAWTFLLILLTLVFEILINHYKPLKEKIKKSIKN